MASRYATRPGRPSINSSARHSARNATDGTFASHSPTYQRRFADVDTAEDEEAPVAFPVWKTIAVVAVVIGCFAAVYPKMFHPMLLYALGYGQTQKVDQEEVFPHPSAKHGAGPSHQGSHPGPIPGGRGPMPGMGAGMHQAGETGGRGSKSVWHWMLPFYTVGVIIFLLYTLSKILWKKPKKENARRRVNVRYNAERDRLETDEPEFDDEEFDEDLEEEYVDGLNGGVMNNRQLHGLQRRLQDTEQTMHEILSQLEQLSSTADPDAAEQIKKMTLETLNNLGKLNTDRATARRRDNGESSRRGRGAGVQFDATERRYLNDLQKALAEFKNFTENYIEEHSQKQRQENPESESKEVVGEQVRDHPEIDNLENVPDASRSDNGEKNSPVEEASNVDEGIDVMEADKSLSSEQLKVEDGEGELLLAKEGGRVGGANDEAHSLVDEEGGANFQYEEKGKKQVRQRKGKRRARQDEYE